MSAVEFTATFGITPGYSFADFSEITRDDGPALDAWTIAMEAEYERSGIVVGAMASAQRVLYPKKFGCPPRGELVVVFTGVSNPNFVDRIAFKEAVQRVVAAVKAKLKQERVTLTFVDVRRHVYFDGDKVSAFEGRS